MVPGGSLLLLVPLVFAAAHFVLVHTEMMRELVPDRFRNDIAHIHPVLERCRFDGELVERDGIGQGHPDTVLLTAGGKRYPFIQTEQSLIVFQPLLFDLLVVIPDDGREGRAGNVTLRQIPMALDVFRV